MFQQQRAGVGPRPAIVGLSVAASSSRSNTSTNHQAALRQQAHEPAVYPGYGRMNSNESAANAGGKQQQQQFFFFS